MKALSRLISNNFEMFEMFGISYTGKRKHLSKLYLGRLHDDLVDLFPVQTLHASLVVIEGHPGEEALSLTRSSPILHPEGEQKPKLTDK